VTRKAVVVAGDMITPYGRGIDACWNGINSGKTAISPVARFSTKAFQSGYAGTVSGLAYHGDESLVMQMLRSLFERSDAVPRDAELILASTKGEIDLLEKSLLSGGPGAEESTLDRLFGKVASLTGAKAGGMIVSAACTSSAAAVARAAARIREGRTSCALVVACDSVTEFIFSGFSSLMALDKGPARPFDRDRTGLTVGEASVYALLMSDERAKQENRTVLGEVAGWGLSDDANHMTGPSRQSEGLILAITKALRSAGAGPEQVGLIAAHGTGTVYNDEMEMRAFRSVFQDGPRPVYSLKGGIGHTMGAAGLVELLIALRALREGIAPPTVNMHAADEDASGWVAPQCRPLPGNSLALVTNAGFSGVNTALIAA
jgi:3-oxoacyl-(acyl-carrier-protein) synthase